jgi:hypothetical protein
MRGASIVRPYVFFAAALFALALTALFAAAPEAPVHAQPAARDAFPLGDDAGAVAVPADGFYFVNDDFKFTIAHKYGIALMRFAGDDEVFVLNVERAAVGGRVLKYDTGDVALQVTGYGAVTLYTSTAPGGLPADRTGDGQPITFPVPTMSALRAQAQQLANVLEQVTNIQATFEADWSHIDDGAARFLTLDAMRITTRALRGLAANRVNEAQLVAKLHFIRFVRGDRPAVVLRNGTLTVTIAPVFGLRGRLSSLATARAIRARL